MLNLNKPIIERIAIDTITKAQHQLPVSNSSIELCFQYFFGKGLDQKLMASNAEYFNFCEFGMLEALAMYHTHNNPQGSRN